MIYSPRAQPEVNKSRIYEVPKNNGLIFHMGEVSELWRKTVVNNSHVSGAHYQGNGLLHVFNLSNCSVVFKV